MAATALPDPWASGPKRPQSALKLCRLKASWLPQLPGLIPLCPEEALQSSRPPGDKVGAKGWTRYHRRQGESSPSVWREATCSCTMESLCSHILAPSPSTGCRPAEGPFLVASEHPPDTRGDTTQPPPPPLKTSRDQPLSPEARPGSGLLNSPDNSVGHCGQYPTEAPLSTQSKRQEQIKNQRAINGGEQDMMVTLVVLCILLGSLLPCYIGNGYNLFLSA